MVNEREIAGVTEVRGFCRNRAQEDDIRASGVSARAIFMDGRGGETLEACLVSFRGRPGTLVLSHDLRVLAGTRRQVAEIMTRLEKAQIKVVDLTHPQDTTIAELQHRANLLISGARFQHDRPRARKQGRAGGRRKGEMAWNRRDEAAPRWLIDRIVDDRRLRWDHKLELLEPHFNKSTLRRHYGAMATARKD
jgi:hypothetical protein